MDRWDFDCQKCGSGIGDAWFVDPEWYQCLQDKHKEKLLEKIYPVTKFYLLAECKDLDKLNKPDFVSNLPILLEDTSIPQNIAVEIVSRIKTAIKEDKMNYKSIETYGAVRGTKIHTLLNTDILFKESKVRWYIHTPWAKKDKEDEYYKNAGIKRHIIKGSGKGRLGYCFCTKCAEKIKYKCDVCSSDLEKIIADQHPGGHWGVRGRRKPGEMVHQSLFNIFAD